MTMVIGEFQLWKCPFSPSFSSPYATDYSANFVACFEPPEEDPRGACSLWKEAVFRLGQKAWLLLDDNQRIHSLINGASRVVDAIWAAYYARRRVILAAILE